MSVMLSPDTPALTWLQVEERFQSPPYGTPPPPPVGRSLATSFRNL